MKFVYVLESKIDRWYAIDCFLKRQRAVEYGEKHCVGHWRIVKYQRVNARKCKQNDKKPRGPQCYGFESGWCDYHNVYGCREKP